MRLPLKIAFRYLFARKSYHVINMISGIGAAGMAIGTAALIVILSVFNGFNELVADSMADAGADCVLRPSAGKVFVPEGPAFDWMLEDDRVLRLTSVLEEQAFLSYEGKQSLARIKGIDAVAEAESPLRTHIIAGEWRLHKGSLPQAVSGVGLAHTLGLNPRFVTPLEIYYPSRNAAVSLSNPAASLRSAKLQTAGIFSVNAALDAKLLIVPIETLRELLEYPREVSSVELWTAPGCTEEVRKELESRLPAGIEVLDRFQQDASLYRMMRYEKLAIYLILIFVVLLITFNIYSAGKMLVIEKQKDMETLRALGASEGLIRRIFISEGFLVSLLGMLAGILLGILLVILQRRFGLVSMPGNFIVDAYPVVLKASDVLMTAAGVSLVGLLMAFLPARKP